MKRLNDLYLTQKPFLRSGLLAMAVCICILVLSSCQKSAPVKTLSSYKSMASVISDQPTLTIFRAALEKSGLQGNFNSLDSLYTVFAPTDSAFLATGMSVDSVSRMGADELAGLLRYHTASGNYPFGAFPVSIPATLIMSDSMAAYINNYGYGLGASINGAFLDTADIQSQNGVLHIIRQVLNYPSNTILQTIDRDPDLSYLRAGFRVLGWDESYFSSGAPVTVLAPTNEAFIAHGFSDTTQFASQYASLNGALGASVLFYQRDFAATGSFFSANDGTMMRITGSEGAFRLQVYQSTRGAGFVQVNRLCKDGLLHKIDNILGKF